jgi:hypothetical protein
MGIQETPTPQHWNYFLALEDDVARLSRYVEPTTANFSTYSLEIARILFAAASEVDVVSKRLCKKIDGKSKADNITKCRKELIAAYPQIPGTIVWLPRFGLTLKPWDEWNGESNPFWWGAYNDVKHHRHTHFAQASLKHALNSVAGLFALLLFFYRDEAESGNLGPDPSIFRVGEPFQIDHLHWFPHSTLYKLADNAQG